MRERARRTAGQLTLAGAMGLRVYGKDVLRARALWTLRDVGYGSTEASVKCSNDCNLSLGVDAHFKGLCMRAGKMVSMSCLKRSKR